MAQGTRQRKTRKSSKFTLALLAVLLLCMGLMLQSMTEQLKVARAEQAIYAQRLAQLQEKNARLAEDIANSNDPKLIEDIAT